MRGFCQGISSDPTAFTHHSIHTPQHTHTTAYTHHSIHTPQHTNTTALNTHLSLHTPQHTHTTAYTHLSKSPSLRQPRQIFPPPIEGRIARQYSKSGLVFLQLPWVMLGIWSVWREDAEFPLQKLCWIYQLLLPGHPSSSPRLNRRCLYTVLSWLIFRACWLPPRNVSPYPTDVSSDRKFLDVASLGQVSLGYFAPDRTIPSLNSDLLERTH